MQEGWLQPGYNEIHNACWDAVRLMKQFQWKFNRIIAIQRGGLLPAVILAHMLELPITVVSYSSKVGKGNDKTETNILPLIDKEDRVLIVDDICDSGNTLYEVKSFYERDGLFAYTFVLYYKSLHAPMIIPDFHWRTIPENAGWIIFPYERDELKDFETLMKSVGVET
jgi:hypoxanthine phosphoribosyltransferase